MISERKRAAELLRAQGLGERAEIEGKKQRELERISSEAYRKAQSIRGKADAEATNIYAAAYSKDPDFYSFLNTLDSYTTTFDKNTTVLLSTESDYFKYMKDINTQ
jgi:membrane protease subunit HflC